MVIATQKARKNKKKSTLKSGDFHFLVPFVQNLWWFAAFLRKGIFFIATLKMSDDGKLFVGGLSFDTGEDVLTGAFSKYGELEKVDVIRDRETGRSRGFGFVKYDNPEDAKDALSGMDGKTLDGRTIRVDFAGRGGGRRGGSGGGGGGFGSRGSRFGQSRGRGGYSRDSGYGGYSDRSYGGDRSYQSRDYSGGYKSGGSSGYRDRNQGGYDRSGGGGGGSYRESYDYASNE